MIIDPQVKELIFEVLSFEDGYNLDGTRTTHMNVPKNMLAWHFVIMDKLSKHARMAFVKKETIKTKEELEEGDIVYHLVSDIKANKAFANKEEMEKYAVCSNSFTTDPLALTKDELDCVRYFYFKREAIDGFSDETKRTLLNSWQ